MNDKGPEALGKESLNRIADEVEQLKGKSWFDAEDEHRRLTGRLSLTRLVFVATLLQDVSLSTMKSLEGMEQETLSKLVPILHSVLASGARSHTDDVTGGVVVVFDPDPTRRTAPSLFWFIETSNASYAYDILRKANDACMVKGVRVLLASDECPSREFTNLDVYFTSPASEEEVDVENEGPVRVVSGIMKNLCAEAKNFPAASAGTVESAKKLAGRQRKSVPSMNRIVACSRSDLYMTAEEFLDIFDTPMYLELDSERVSPFQPVVDYDSLWHIVSQKTKI